MSDGPITFKERVSALVGKTTWREPSDGVRGEMKAIPSDHLIAAALSFGRTPDNPIGPDIAFDIATGRDGHRPKVTMWLAKTLAADRSAHCKRIDAARYIPHYAVWAYNSVVFGTRFPPAPHGVTDKDHGEVALLACLLLDRAAEDALASAASKARAA